MKHFSLYKMNFVGLFFSLLVLLVSVSCIRVDTPPVLEIIVLDQFNNPVSEAVVGIFDDREQWGMLENPAQVWKSTDEDGSVLFTGLFEKHYYIYAEKDGENNLKNEMVTQIPLMMNEQRRLIIHID